MDAVSERLRRWRKDRELSQAAVGEAVGIVLNRRIGQSTIANYESRGVPDSWRFLEALAEKFPDLDMNLLFRGEDKQTSKPSIPVRSSAVGKEGQYLVKEMASVPFRSPEHFLTPAELSDVDLDTYRAAIDVALRVISRKLHRVR